MSDLKQVYNPQTGEMEFFREEAGEKDARQQAETEQPVQKPEPETADPHQEKTGGAAIVDFNYERYAEVEYQATHTNAIAALTLGILSIVLGLFSGLLSIIAGVVGLVFAVKGRRDPKKKGMATAGMVCSIIGMILGLLRILTLIFLFFLLATDNPMLYM